MVFSHWWSVLFELPHADHRLPVAPHADLKENGSWLYFPPRLAVVLEGATAAWAVGTVCTHTKLETSPPLAVEEAYHARTPRFKDPLHVAKGSYLSYLALS